MRWPGLLAGLAFALAACVAAAATIPKMTLDGLGPLKIGMGEAVAARRFGLRLNQADGEDCHVLDVRGRTDLTVMTRNGRVASLIVYGPSRLRTDRGIGIGSGEAEVRRAYGPSLKIEPNIYEDPPAHYLTYWAKLGVRGVMIETDRGGRVSGFRVGDETIQWTDGCG